MADFLLQSIFERISYIWKLIYAPPIDKSIYFMLLCNGVNQKMALHDQDDTLLCVKQLLPLL
jgi:hypothetical protein